MKRTIAIISLFFLISFRTRFLRQVFSYLSLGAKTKGKILLIGGLLALSFVIYNHFFPTLTINSTITPYSILTLLGYYTSIILLITLSINQFKNKKIGTSSGIGLLLVIIITLYTFFTTTQTITRFTYYIIIASIEERVKFNRSENTSIHSSQNSTTQLLLYSILIGFSFSLSENLISRSTSLLNLQLTSSLLIGRGLLSTMLHCLATGSIALLIIKYQKHSQSLFHKRSITTLSLLVGFAIHSIYNISLYTNQSWIAIPITIAGFFGLTYLLFHLDELYHP